MTFAAVQARLQAAQSKAAHLEAELQRTEHAAALQRTHGGSTTPLAAHCDIAALTSQVDDPRAALATGVAAGRLDASDCARQAGTHPSSVAPLLWARSAGDETLAAMPSADPPLADIMHAPQLLSSSHSADDDSGTPVEAARTAYVPHADVAQPSPGRAEAAESFAGSAAESDDDASGGALGMAELLEEVQREVSTRVAASMRLKLGLLAWFCSNLRTRCHAEVLARWALPACARGQGSPRRRLRPR